MKCANPLCEETVQPPRLYCSRRCRFAWGEKKQRVARLLGANSPQELAPKLRDLSRRYGDRAAAATLNISPTDLKKWSEEVQQ